MDITILGKWSLRIFVDWTTPRHDIWRASSLASLILTQLSGRDYHATFQDWILAKSKSGFKTGIKLPYSSLLLAMLTHVRRRAKLKRLTMDDQEHMRRSRALPEDFNFSQTLQPNFREARSLYGSALHDPLMLGGGISQRPNLRLGMSHLSTNLSFPNKIPSPISTTGSANPSPVSSVNEGSERSSPYFSATQSPLVTSPQFTNPFGRAHSLSVGSGRPSSQNTMMGPGGQAFTAPPPSTSSFTNTSYGYGNLPPLQFSRTTFQTREDQNLSRIQTTEGPILESGVRMNQSYISPLSSPSPSSHNQSTMFDLSGSGFRASSYYQSSDTTSWQGTQTNPQDYQYGQPLQPHQPSEQRRQSEWSQSTLSQDPSINRHDQRSYSLSGEQYRRVSPFADSQSPPTFLGAGAATAHNLQPTSEAARPRARSATFPAPYSTLWSSASYTGRWGFGRWNYA